MNNEGLCTIAREIYVRWQDTFILCSVILSYNLKMCYKRKKTNKKMCYKVIVCLMFNFKLCY